MKLNKGKNHQSRPKPNTTIITTYNNIYQLYI